MKANYHHGDLRAAALKAGLDLLGERDGDDLGLRELARHIGVSAPALYRHFPDKDALMRALAHEASELMALEQKNAAKKVKSDQAGLVAMGKAYVDFAVANPALFRVIFRNSPTIDPLGGQLDEVGSGMRMLRENIAALMPDDMPEKERRSAVLHAWSLVHGLSWLILDKQIEYDPDLVRKVASIQDISPR